MIISNTLLITIILYATWHRFPFIVKIILIDLVLHDLLIHNNFVCHGKNTHHFHTLPMLPTLSELRELVGIAF